MTFQPTFYEILLLFLVNEIIFMIQDIATQTP